jgi:light-regulated signal transduction histidine kinase (bacteriophytochrome)
VEAAFDHWRAHPEESQGIETEYRIVRPDGTLSWIRGRLLRASGIAEDVTAQKLAELALRREREELEERVAQRTAELEAANRELEAFSYSVSHDLRAPLRIVNGFADALLEDFGHGLPPEALRYIGNLREGGRRMSELIGDLLSFSQLGRRSIERAPVDVQALVEACLAELGQATRDGAVVTVGPLAACSGDVALLKQVFLNLLSNAFKYSRNRRPARIEVGCRENEAGETVYFVRDNGTGFDMSYAHRLFHVFQRLHREQEFEGTGVGLAIVKRIVSSHGGRVWAEAAPERGATFSFTVEPASN